MLGTTKQNRILVYSVTIVSYYAPIILNYKKIKIKKKSFDEKWFIIRQYTLLLS